MPTQEDCVAALICLVAVWIACVVAHTLTVFAGVLVYLTIVVIYAGFSIIRENL